MKYFFISLVKIESLDVLLIFYIIFPLDFIYRTIANNLDHSLYEKKIYLEKLSYEIYYDYYLKNLITKKLEND